MPFGISAVVKGFIHIVWRHVNGIHMFMYPSIIGIHVFVYAGILFAGYLCFFRNGFRDNFSADRVVDFHSLGPLYAF